MNPNGTHSPRHNAVSAIALTMFSDFVLEGEWTRESPKMPGFFIARNADDSTAIIRLIRLIDGRIHCLDPVSLLKSIAIWSRPLPVDVLPAVPDPIRHQLRLEETEDDGA